MTAPSFYDLSSHPAAAASTSRRIVAYNEQFEDATAALHDIYQQGQADLTVGITRLEQVTQVLTHLRDHGQSADAQEGFRQGRQLALGSGTGSSDSDTGLSANALQMLQELAQASDRSLDEFVADTYDGFKQAIGAGDKQAKARMHVSAQVVNGTIKVTDDGVLETEKQLTDVRKQLSDEQEASKELKAFRDQFPDLDRASNKDDRLMGMQLIADGTTPVDGSGHALPGSAHPLVQENNKIKAIVGSIKSALEPKKMGVPVVGDRHEALILLERKLSPDAKAELGLK